jgi:hypothetical protein
MHPEEDFLFDQKEKVHSRFPPSSWNKKYIKLI